MVEDHYITPHFGVSIMHTNTSIEPCLVRVPWTFRALVHGLHVSHDDTVLK